MEWYIGLLHFKSDDDGVARKPPMSLIWISMNRRSKMKILALFLYGFLVRAENIYRLNELVQTLSGSIQGTFNSVHGVPVRVFLGIPYAESPLGDQRFLKPKPVKPWSKTLEAINFSPACIQYTKYPFPLSKFYSAGSISVSLLCVSPLTKGLFNRAIMESGTTIVLTSNQLRLNLDFSQQVAETVGCAPDDKKIDIDPESLVSCLRSQNATYLAYVLWSLNPTATVYFWPQYGDDLFPSTSLDDIRNGNFHNVSILIGNTRNEGSFFITTLYPEIFGFFGEKNTVISKIHAGHIIRNFFSNYDDPEIYIKYYLDNVPDNDYNAIRRQTYTAVGDSIFLCPSVYFAESYAERKNDVYFYLFTHRPSNSVWAPWMGVEHFEEIQFVFGRPILNPELYEDNEIELSKKMIEIWTNFAKYG
ncbi:unnamed protein product [Larinioides sclopetarius]|uniref:Carboxylesterase type B domain-containing protein n=1 Tax=Larinioides sclopetarius TaxID=280406 RepID=A0AAV2BAU2_9ARAC